jgi:carboxylesterase type B
MRSRDETGWHQREWAQLTVKRGKKAYLYYFTHVPPGAGARGASHTAELPYMFNNPPANDSWMVLDHKLADMMSSYWVNFISTGDPNGKGLPVWPAYSAKNDSQAMVFGDTVQFGPQIEAPRLAFFDKYYAVVEKR